MRLINLILKIAGLIFLLFTIAGVIIALRDPTIKKTDLKKPIEKSSPREEKLLTPTRTPKFENELYEFSKQLNKKYNDELFANDNIPSGDQLVEAEERSIKETAEKFNISEKEVIEIYLRVDSTRYRK